jgi:hypothetical protein
VNGSAVAFSHQVFVTMVAAEQSGPLDACCVAHRPGCWSKTDMSNWIETSGHAPQVPSQQNSREDNFDRDPKRPRTVMQIVGAALLLAMASQIVQARDRGQFANTNPDIKAWFDRLASRKGPCCSDADGSAVSDVDWETSGGHYRVRLEGEWIDVPEEAVITEPNRVGRTMVWPIRGYLGLTIRCFMPGSMT